MFISHLNRILKNKINVLFFCLIIIIPMLEILQLLKYQKISGEVFHPAFAFYLSASSIGHAPQIILLWFLPIYLLLLGTDDAIQDYKTGYRNVLISKIGRKKYYLEKLSTAFIISSMTMFISLFLNFLFVKIIFSGGTFSRGILEVGKGENLLFNYSIEHPYYAVICFAIVTCVLAGLAGTLGASLSLFFLDKKYTYASAFFIWFLLVLNRNSLMYLFQPFAEYGFNVLLPILYIALTVLLVIPIIVYIYGVKFNEN